MTVCDLSNKTCEPCQGGMPALSAEDAERMMIKLDGWTLSQDAKSVHKRWAFKGFAKAVELANLAAWHGNKQGHHPDIAFGWGYCCVTYTTHEIDGLSENDFICAAKLDALLV